MELQASTPDRVNFEKAYGMLPAMYQTPFRNSLMKTCGWRSIMTFHKKKAGVTSIGPLEADAIEKAFAAYELDAWTGERIMQKQSV